MTDAQSAQNALDNLIEAVEAGWAPDVLEHSDAMSAKYIRQVMDAYHGSLDAALALHEALLPGWRARIDVGTRRHRCWTVDPMNKKVDAYGSSPARAWLLAILRAYRSMQP